MESGIASTSEHDFWKTDKANETCQPQCCVLPKNTLVYEMTSKNITLLMGNISLYEKPTMAEQNRDRNTAKYANFKTQVH